MALKCIYATHYADYPSENIWFCSISGVFCADPVLMVTFHIFNDIFILQQICKEMCHFHMNGSVIKNLIIPFSFKNILRFLPAALIPVPVVFFFLTILLSFNQYNRQKINIPTDYRLSVEIEKSAHRTHTLKLKPFRCRLILIYSRFNYTGNE